MGRNMADIVRIIPTALRIAAGAGLPFFPEQQNLLGGGILSFELAQVSYRVSSEAHSSGSLQPTGRDVGADRLPTGGIDRGQVAGLEWRKLGGHRGDQACWAAHHGR